jgi:phenylacetate-CoA ligase
MGHIVGRSDDMLIIRGVNVYPSQVGSVLGRVPELSPHFGLVVRRLGALDEVEVLAEPRTEILPSLTDERVRELSERAAGLIRDTIGCTMAVTLVGPGEAPRSDGGKIQRVTDLRS